jgi:carotenoid cleavage dioxygenase
MPASKHAATESTSKWVDGYYAPVDEEVTATDLLVEGDLPEELTGRYVRIGPNPFGPVDPATYHWFTGDGMAHGLRIEGGQAAWYRNRWIRSTALSKALGEQPAPGERHGEGDVVNTNIINIGGVTHAVVEAGSVPVALTDELETVKHSDLDGTLPHGFTAHPKVDPSTGDLHAIAYYWAIPHLEYIVVGGDGRVRQVEPIEVNDGPMVHDCSITEHWMVVYDLPVTFDIDEAMGGAHLPYTWNPAHAARIGLMPLGGPGSDVKWFDVDPCFVFHPVNAFDDGQKVVIDLVRYDRMFDAVRLGPDDVAPRLWRWTIDTETGHVAERQLAEQSLEFPRVDERVVGRRH